MKTKLWREIREWRPIRQYQIAEKLKMRPARLNMLASGAAKPQILEIEKLTTFFNKSEQELFEPLFY